MCSYEALTYIGLQLMTCWGGYIYTITVLGKPHALGEEDRVLMDRKVSLIIKGKTPVINAVIYAPVTYYIRVNYMGHGQLLPPSNYQRWTDGIKVECMSINDPHR
jgi:hypothetical protein